jgi:hypothetical protein
MRALAGGLAAGRRFGSTLLHTPDMASSSSTSSSVNELSLFFFVYDLDWVLSSGAHTPACGGQVTTAHSSELLVSTRCPPNAITNSETQSSHHQSQCIHIHRSSLTNGAVKNAVLIRSSGQR